MAIKGKETIDIRATRERVLEVVTDFDAYPDWMPGYLKAEVLERDGHGRPTKVEHTVDSWGTRTYTLEYIYGDVGISWRKVAGDGKEILGSHMIDLTGDSVRVVHSYSIDPGAPVPDFILKPGVKKSVQSNLAALKQRAEA